MALECGKRNAWFCLGFWKDVQSGERGEIILGFV